MRSPLGAPAFQPLSEAHWRRRNEQRPRRHLENAHHLEHLGGGERAVRIVLIRNDDTGVRFAEAPDGEAGGSHTWICLESPRSLTIGREAEAP